MNISLQYDSHQLQAKYYSDILNQDTTYTVKISENVGITFLSE